MPQQTTVSDVMAWLKKTGSPRAAAGLSRYGLPTDRAFGISVAALRAYAKRIGSDHGLALKLWKTGWLDARILASFLADPGRVTPAMMDDWCGDFDNWGTTDTACFTLFDRSPHAWKKAKQWVKRKPEFEKRAGFVLMACLAAHDKSATDTAFLEFLPMIEAGADDERNFVKKGVSWALRHIGHRNARLHAAAVKTASKLAASADRTERWVGKDALRDLLRPSVIRKVARR
jgi:3-methyladenine DNA glycosylase AlkD